MPYTIFSYEPFHNLDYWNYPLLDFMEPRQVREQLPEMSLGPRTRIRPAQRAAERARRQLNCEDKPAKKFDNKMHHEATRKTTPGQGKDNRSPSNLTATREEKPQDHQRLEKGLDELRDINRTGASNIHFAKIGPDAFEISTRADSLNVTDTFEVDDNLTSSKLSTAKKDIKSDVDEDFNSIRGSYGDNNETNKVETTMGASSSSAKANKLKLIGEIGKEVQKLSDKVEELSGKEKIKDFLYLEEMLTKCLLKLDDISTEGLEDVRKSRKEIVEKINSKLQNLEEKLELRRKKEERLNRNHTSESNGN